MSEETGCPNCGRERHGVCRTYQCPRCHGDNDVNCLRLTVERMRPVVEAARRVICGEERTREDGLRTMFVLARAVEVYDGKASQ